MTEEISHGEQYEKFNIFNDEAGLCARSGLFNLFLTQELMYLALSICIVHCLNGERFDLGGLVAKTKGGRDLQSSANNTSLIPLCANHVQASVDRASTLKYPGCLT